MAASKDKASALKNSYVDGIIDELGGASDPAVRMSLRENDQASIHSFPAEGKTGAINDGDPSLYIHGGGKSYEADSGSEYANPIPGAGPGERMLIDSKQETIDGSNNYLNEMERRMGGSGDLARARPKSQEDYKRKPQLLGNASFDASNLGGAMGMEQGNTAGVIVDLQNNVMIRANDGNPRLVIRDGSRRSVEHNSSAKYPITGGKYNARDVSPLPGNLAYQSAERLHNGGNAVDTTVYDGSRSGGRDEMNSMYKEQMYQNYTR